MKSDAQYLRFETCYQVIFRHVCCYLRHKHHKGHRRSKVITVCYCLVNFMLIVCLYNCLLIQRLHIYRPILC